MSGGKKSMTTKIYDHRSGVSVVPKQQIEEIIGVISGISPLVQKNTVTIIRENIITLLGLQGWTGEHRLDVTSKITISSYKNGSGLCLQTGNVSRIYADLLKLQTLYLSGKIKAGIIILPQKSLALKLASNMANYERLLLELPIFSQVISMPLVIIGFDVEDKK